MRVTAGLDPAVHAAFSFTQRPVEETDATALVPMVSMDCRVKLGNDDELIARRAPFT